MVGKKDGQRWSPDDCYVQERQLVLSLCLNKLQYSQVPSLCRFVLLANTMRQIQREITQEEENPPEKRCSTPQSHSQGATSFCMPEVLLQSSDCLPIMSYVDQGAGDLTCSSFAEKVEMEMEESFFPSAFATSPSTPFTDSSLIGVMSVFEAGNSLACLNDLAIDDIFEDIDTSMFDSSDASSIMTCVFCSVSHMFDGDEGNKILPDCPLASPLQCSQTDLTGLDHIMEVLVGLV